MQCNLDARGKSIRLISGSIVLVIGVGLAVVVAMGWLTGWWLWAVAAGLIVAGAFQIYEGWCGWCVLRAMGFKTPI